MPVSLPSRAASECEIVGASVAIRIANNPNQLPIFRWKRLKMRSATRLEAVANYAMAHRACWPVRRRSCQTFSSCAAHASTALLRCCTAAALLHYCAVPPLRCCWAITPPHRCTAIALLRYPTAVALLRCCAVPPLRCCCTASRPTLYRSTAAPLQWRNSLTAQWPDDPTQSIEQTASGKSVADSGQCLIPAIGTECP